jgi:hypothetical protein
MTFAVGDVLWEAPDVEDDEVIAKELSDLGDKVRGLETRMAEVEKVNARLEDAALTTARALQEISGHWNAVYEAMRREEKDSGDSSQRDYAASKARRDGAEMPPRPDH